MTNARPGRRAIGPPASRLRRRDSAQRVVERARAGDTRAFAELVDRYAKAVLSLCYASLLNPTDAEDVTQEVFLAAWRGLPRFRQEASFATWLFALARNACVDFARHHAARPRVAAQSAPEGAGERNDDAHRTALAILSAAADLSGPLREAVLMRDLQGLSYEQIAELQDVPVGTVKSRIASARASLARTVSR